MGQPNHLGSPQASSVGPSAFPLLAPNGTSSNPSYSWSSETGLGIYRDSAGSMTMVAGGTNQITFIGNSPSRTVCIRSDGTLGWTASANSLDVVDTALVRDGSGGIVALKNAGNPQEIRVYGTTTGPKYTTIQHSGTIGFIGGHGGINFGIAGVGGYWGVTNSGHWVNVSADNSFDIGASGASRPRNIFVGGYVAAGKQCLTKTSSPYAVSTAESNAEYNNNGAGAQVIFNLPASAVGLQYSFYVATAQNIRLAANGSETIRNAASVSTASTGHVDNATVGGYIHLVCHVVGQWVAKSTVGTWTVT